MSKTQDSSLATLLFLIVAILASGCSAPEISAKTNVVVIILDTLRADVLGLYGHELVDASPELDALGDQSVVFERVIAPASWTRPSIGSMLTGLYPRTLGIYKEKWDVLDGRHTQLATYLKRHGYTTIGVTANPNIASSFGFSAGFDAYVDSRAPFGWMRSRPGTSESEGTDQHEKPPVKRSAAEVFDEAMRLAKEHPHPPYYLQLNVMEMHEWEGVSREDGVLGVERPEGMDPRRWKYLVMLRKLSTQVQSFVQELSALPDWKDTLFVFVSDHGEGLDDHPGVAGAWRHGFVLYDSNVVVPWFMLHTGGGLAPKRVARQVELLDMTPTILDLLGLPVPSALDGKSLVSLIQDPSRDPKRPPFAITESRFRGTRKIAAIGESSSFFAHRDGWKGTRPYELWIAGESAPLDANRRPRLSQGLALALQRWERSHDEVPPSNSNQPVPDDTVEQLKALGYLE